MIRTRPRPYPARRARPKPIRRRPDRAKSPKDGQRPQLPALVENPREARLRLDQNDCNLLIAGLVQLLPEKIRANRSAWYELPYDQQQKLRPIRALIGRLQSPRRGHPSTWGY